MDHLIYASGRMGRVLGIELGILRFKACFLTLCVVLTDPSFLVRVLRNFAYYFHIYMFGHCLSPIMLLSHWSYNFICRDELKFLHMWLMLCFFSFPPNPCFGSIFTLSVFCIFRNEFGSCLYLKKIFT